MKSSKRVVVAGLILLGACTSSDGALQRATAKMVGQNVTPEQVKLNNVHHTVVDVTWDADTPAGQYACSSDDAMHRPKCDKHP
jgi:hypothetical protein